jgi:hypothetical protein
MRIHKANPHASLRMTARWWGHRNPHFSQRTREMGHPGAEAAVDFNGALSQR